MGWSAHRINDGKIVRRGAALVLIGLLLFACSRWYYWVSPWTWQISETTIIPLDFSTMSLGFVSGLVGIYYLIYVWPRAGNFLIETEAELRKVTWPAYKPWFRSSTEIWGSSYVVLVVLSVLGVIIFSLDWLLSYLASVAFYKL